MQGVWTNIGRETASSNTRKNTWITQSEFRKGYSNHIFPIRNLNENIWNMKKKIILMLHWP